MALDRSARLDARNEIACAWFMVGCLVVTVVGFVVIAGYVPPPRADDTTEEIVAFYRDNTEQIRLGLSLTILSWAGWGGLVAALSSQMSRIEGRAGVMTLLQAVSGACSWACLVVPVILLSVTSFRPERDPELTHTLHDLGWIASFMPVAPFCVMAAAIGIATLQDERPDPVYPRWFGYANLWFCVLFVPGAALLMFKSGLLAYHGLLVFYIPLFFFFAWILLLIWGIRRAALAQLKALPQSSDTLSEQTVASPV
ncbi:MAG: hypothetical protein ACT4QG_14365 [Sporichthyaceae bacterium]